MEKDIYSEALMRYYAKQSREPVQGFVDAIPYIVIQEDGSQLLELRICTKDRMYVVKNLTSFLEDVAKGNVHKYGKDFSFPHTLDSFTAQSRRFVGQLLSLLEEYISYHAHFLPDDKKTALRFLPLFARQFEQILSACTDSLVGYGDSFDSCKLYPVKSENPPLVFSITRENNRILLTPSTENFHIFGRFLFTNDCFFRADNAYFRTAFPPLKLMAQKGEYQLVISEIEASRFVSGAVVAMEASGIVDTDSRFESSVVRAPLKTQIYIEGSDEKIVARVEFHYGDCVFIPFAPSQTVLAVVRDKEMEKEVLSRLKALGFRRKGTEYLLSNPDRIFDFLTGDNASLSEVASLVYESGFLKIARVQTGSVSCGVRLSDEKLLKISVDAPKIPSEELYDFMRSLRLKKRYHRIKDGTFFRLDTPELVSFSDFVDGMGLTRSSFVDGTVTLSGAHTYRIDSLLKDARFKVQTDDAFRRMTEALESSVSRTDNTDIPESLTEILRPYQKEAFHWLKVHAATGLGGILADDMGLGKTLEILALLLSEREKRPAPAIIVVPTSLVYNWVAECEKFTPSLKAKAVIGKSEERHAMLSDLSDTDLIITSYETIRRDFPYYAPHRFSFLILDEAQYIKNANTQNARTIKTIHADVRFALTGTPIENSLAELWSIFDFLLPDYLGTYKKFRTRFEHPIVREKSEEALSSLRRMIAPFFLRRIKEDVLTELPPKTEQTMLCPMTPEQEELYAAYFSSARQDFLDELSEKGFDRSRFKILSLLMRLRQLCCHPALFLEDYEGGSGKYELAMELIVEGLASGHSILIFSQFTSMLDILAEGLNELALDYFYLRGSTPSQERTAMADSFNNHERPIFLASLKAGGTGLNLTGADMVIHFDPWWNPAVEAQATDRAYRIGQNRPVNVIRLITADTIEQRVDAFKELKSHLAESILSSEETFGASLTHEMAMKLFE
ncbi:MAG: DEAD/DEAH box helicase [Clostridia bacterium]|nr:DEAD/DEAH box helicase [Clostridia bacterium]